MRLYIGGSY